MKPTAALPEVLERLCAPAYLSPSRIAVAEQCLVRFVAESTLPDDELLPRGPAAILGERVHAFVEGMARGTIDVPEPSFAAVRGAWEHFSAERDRALALDPRYGHMAPLRRVFGAVSWAKRTVPWLERSLLDTRGRATAYNSSSAAAEVQRWRGDEEAFVDEDLRLRGRLDSWYLDGRRAVILDYKTGRVRDESGAVSAQVRDQLAAYALLVKRRHRVEHVVGRVESADGVDELVFDEAALDAIGSRVRRIGESLPRDEPLDVGANVRLSLGCLQCRFRHRCPAWRTAPDELRRPLGERTHVDVWGIVRDVDVHGGVLGIAVCDERGVMVHLERIDTRHLGSSSDLVGDAIAAFGLHSDGREGSKQSVYELSADRRMWRAWTVRFWRARGTS